MNAHIVALIQLHTFYLLCQMILARTNRCRTQVQELGEGEKTKGHGKTFWIGSRDVSFWILLCNAFTIYEDGYIDIDIGG